MKQILKDKNGRLYNDYSHEEYHEIGFEEAISASQFKLFCEHERCLLEKKVKKNKGMLIGTAFEDYLYFKLGIKKDFWDLYFDCGELDLPTNVFEILENKMNIGREFYYEMTPKTNVRKKSSSNDCIDAIFDNNMKTPLSSEDLGLLEKMFDTFSYLEAFPGVRYVEILPEKGVEIEKIIVWEDGYGIKKKCKPDLIIKVDDRIYYDDLKTTSSTLQGFASDINNYKYPIQAVHTREGIQSAYPDYDVIPCRYPVVSKATPVLSKLFSYSNNKNYDEWQKYDDYNFRNYKKYEDFYKFKMFEFKDFLGRHKKGFINKCDNEVGYIKVSTYNL